MTAHPPVVIEAALNGMTTREANPYVPRTVDEIVDSGLACVDAGTSIIHNHNDEPNFGGATRHCAEPYLAAWRRLLQRHPRLLLHPTTAGATPDSTVEERFAHVMELHEAGVLGLGTCDGGSEGRDAYAADALLKLVEGGGQGKARSADLVIVCDLRAFRRGHAHPGDGSTSSEAVPSRCPWSRKSLQTPS